MSFFNPRRVAEKLRDNALSETTRYHFIVAGLLLQGGHALVSSLLAPGTPGQRMVGSFTALVVSLVGVHFAHRINERGDNRAFIERWFCLSVPLTLWMYNAPYLVEVGLYYIVGGVPLFGRIWTLIPAVNGLLMILFYVTLAYYMRVASGERRFVETQEAPIAAP